MPTASSRPLSSALHQDDIATRLDTLAWKRSEELRIQEGVNG
jgi:hypothetical protein